MNVCVYGLWHLGSVISACLAELDINVIGLDSDFKAIKKLNTGTAPLFELGLDELIKKGLKKGNLHFTTDSAIALKNADFLWVSFDTPVNNKDVADVNFVKNQIISISNYIENHTKIIISSQVPVGFSRELEKAIPNNPIAYSPENLRLGKAVNIFKNPDRIVVGIRNKKDTSEFDQLFLKITNRIEWMKTESAEMTKHALNAFLATSVVFANEIASLCESTGADATEVSKGLKSEERIGPKAYLGPGLPYAGGTLARDINFLITLSRNNSKRSYLLQAVNKSNNYHKNWIKQKCIDNFNNLNNIKFLLLGLTYKPGTNTLRRSSSVELAKWIYKKGGIVNCYDPLVKKLPGSLTGKITLVKEVEEIIDNSDCLIISTEHKEFQDLFSKLKNKLDNKIIIDPTSFIEKHLENKSKIKYISVGR